MQSGWIITNAGLTYKINKEYGIVLNGSYNMSNLFFRVAATAIMTEYCITAITIRSAIRRGVSTQT